MSKTGGIGRWVRNFLGISALSSEMDKLRREVKDFGDVHNDNHLEVIRRQELAEKRVDDMWRDVRKLIKESTDEVRKEQSESSAQILSAIGDLGKKIETTATAVQVFPPRISHKIGRQPTLPAYFSRNSAVFREP